MMTPDEILRQADEQIAVRKSSNKPATASGDQSNGGWSDPWSDAPSNRGFAPGVRTDGQAQQQSSDGFGARLKQGIGRAVDSAQVALSGDEGVIAKVAADQQRNALPQTALQRQMAEEIAPYNEAAKNAEGFVDSARAWGALGLKRAGQLISNPAEAGKMIVEQLPNSIPGLAGGFAGAKAGAAVGTAVAPGPGTFVGAALGGLAGGFAGGYGLEKGASVLEQVQEKAHQQGVDLQDQNAARGFVAKNLAEIDEAATRKAVGTAGTDAALNVLTMGAAGLSGRGIVNEARALAKAVDDGIVSAADATAALARLEAANAARNTVGQKALRGGAVVGAEMASEGVSEAVGQKYAYGEVDPGQVIDEALLGLGQGGAMALGGKAFRKAAGLPDNDDAATRSLDDVHAALAKSTINAADAAPGGDMASEAQSQNVLALPAPVIDVGGDGVARTADDRNARLRRIATGDITDVTPIERAPVEAKPSEAMGLRTGPDAGPLENAAALSVDTGVTAQMQGAAGIVANDLQGEPQAANAIPVVDFDEVTDPYERAMLQRLYDDHFADGELESVISANADLDTSFDFGANVNQLLANAGATPQEIEDAQRGQASAQAADRPGQAQENDRGDFDAELSFAKNEGDGSGRPAGAEQGEASQQPLDQQAAAPGSQAEGANVATLAQLNRKKLAEMSDDELQQLSSLLPADHSRQQKIQKAIQTRAAQAQAAINEGVKADGTQADQTQQAIAQPTQAGAAQAGQPATSNAGNAGGQGGGQGGGQVLGATDSASAAGDQTTTISPNAAPNAGVELAAMGDAGKAAEQSVQGVPDVTKAGQQWKGMTTAQRQEAVARAQGIAPVIAKNMPRAEWGNLNADIQRKLADAMGTTPAQDSMANNPQSQSQQAQESTEQQAAPGRQSTESAYTLPSGSIGDEWRDEQKREPENPDYAPTPRQQRLMNEVKKVLDSGAFYNDDVTDKVAKALGVSDEVLASNRTGVKNGDFGYDVYHARKAVQAKALEADAAKIRAELNLQAGDKLGTLIFNDFKQTNSVEVVSVTEDGRSASFKGKRGAATVTFEATVPTVKFAIERAHEKGKRKDSYEEFIAGRAADKQATEQPPAQSQQEQAATKPEASAATDFIPAPDGGLDYGEITPEMGRAMRRQAGKIRLRQGNEAWGLTHIKNRHDKDFAALGFNSAQDFVSQVASGFTKIYKGRGSALDVVLDEQARGMLIVSLEPSVDGDFYDIKTATPIRRDQFKNETPLWERAGPSASAAVKGSSPYPKGQSGSASVPLASVDAKAAKPANIEDFGEKLEGARKDLPPSLKEEVSDEQMASLPLSKIWPANAHEEIQNDAAAALAFAARQEIPAKPRQSVKVQRWVQKVKSFRALVTSDEALAGQLDKLGLDGLSQRVVAGSALEGFFAKVRLLAQLPRDTWGRVEKVREYPDAVRYGEDGQKTPIPFSAVVIDGEAHQFDGAKSIGPDEVSKIKELLGTAAPKKGGLTAADFEIRTYKNRNESFINRKGDKEMRHLKTFTGKDSATQARQWLNANVGEAEAQWEAVKARDNVGKGDVRTAQNRQRVGADHRKGADVTAQMFEDAFGFRGVQFGNWVAQGAGAKDRQGLLNEAYDALMDLSLLLGVPSRAMSLNGSLGLSLGARGSGKAAAHFEPDSLVINLTKTKGAGSLAHEWFHALDNYFSRMRGGEVAFTGDNNAYRQNNFVTYKPEAAWGKAPITPYTNFMRGGQLRERLQRLPGFTYDANKTLAENAKAAGFERDLNHKDGVRPQVEKAFADLVQALNDSPMAKRASSLDKAADGYWGRIIERGARSFENYVINKMALQGYSNDFLANIRNFDEWQALGKNAERYPYLTPAEEGPVVEAFDNLFETIETRQGDDGNVELYFAANPARRPGTAQDKAVMQALADGKSARDVLRLIASGSKDPFLRQVARLLLKAGITPNIQFGHIGKTEKGDLIHGQYRGSSGTILIAGSAEYAAERIFMHEAMHAATMRALANPGLLKLQLQKLLEHVRKQPGAAGFYGLKNVDEFVAEVFTNPDFQAALRKMNAPSGSSGIKTAWDGFVRILRSILGLKNDPNNALSQALELGVAAMREDMGLRRRGEQAPNAGRALMHSERQIEAVTLKLAGWTGSQGQLRDLAGAWYNENLRGKSFPNDDMGVQVQFSSEGRNAAFATSGNLRAGWRAEMVKALPDLIQRAVKVAQALPDERKAHKTRMMHTLVAPLAVNGKTYAAKITLREALQDPNGVPHKFYDVTALEIENGPEMFGVAPGVATGPVHPTGTEPLRVSVAELAKASTGKYPGTTDFDTIAKSVLPSNARSDTGDVRIVYPDGQDGQDGVANFGVDDFARIKTSALDQITKSLSHPGKVSLWDKTVGTMRNLAERVPQFKPVFEAAQRFIDDVSMLANDAADFAPRLMPRVESWGDLKKKPITAADNKAVAKPLFEGTLMWARDLDGTPVTTEALNAKYRNMPADEKAQVMLRTGKLDDRVLKMWKGMPIESYEKAVASKFDSTILKPGVVWSQKELKDIFKLDDKQASLYQEARAAIDRSLDMTARTDMLRLLGDEFAGMRSMVLEQESLKDAFDLVVDTLQEEARANPDMADRLMGINNSVVNRYETATELMEKGYAPLSRFGKYTVDVVDANGERQYFGMFESMREANQMAMKMRDVFKGAAVTQGTMSEQAFKLFQGITPESLEMFGSMLGLKGDGSEAQDKAFQAYLQLAKNNHSALKRLIHRKGIDGYSEDVGRVLASFVYSNARLGSQGLNAGTMETAIEGIPKEMGELRDVAMGLRNYIQDPQEEGQAVRGMLFAQYLGGSVASAFVNMTQPFQITMPWLSQYGGMGQAAKQMARALKDMGTKGFKYEADLAKALQSAEDDGVVSPQEIHQLMAQARGAGSLRTGDGTKLGDARAAAVNNWERVKVAWGQPFALAEQFNRRSTFIASYRIAKAQGIADPAGFARRAVLETQFLYSKANKMRWGRGAIGGTLMTFKTYSVSYLELMHRMWNQGEPGSPERAAGRRAVAWAVAMLLLMGGAGGLPFMEDAEDLIDMIGQMMGYNLSTKQARKEFLADIVGKEFAEFMEHGASGLPGAPIDVSGRLGMGNLIPGTGLFLSKQNRERDLTEIAGPAGDLVTRGFSAGKSVLSGVLNADASEFSKAAMEIAPTAVRNAAKGIDMATSGIYKDTKGYKVMDVTLGEAISKFAGFQPKSVAEDGEASSFKQRTKSFYIQTSADIKAQWADAIFRKDDAALERVRERLAAWNRNNPDLPITVKIPDIMKRVREMGKDREQRINDTAPKALRQQFREMSLEASR